MSLRTLRWKQKVGETEGVRKVHIGKHRNIATKLTGE